MARKAAVGVFSLAVFFLLSSVVESAAQARRLRLYTKSVRVKLRKRRPTKGMVASRVRSQTNTLKICLKNSVKQRRYSGWLWLTFKFMRNGRVYSPTATSTLGNKFAMTCIKMTLKRWTIAKGGGGQVTASIKVVK